MQALLIKKWNKNLLMMSIILGFYWLFNFMRRPESATGLLSVFVQIILFFVVSSYYREYKHINFDEVLYKFILILALISLVIWFLIHMFSINLPYRVIQHGKNVTYYSYWNIYYEMKHTQIALGKIKIARLQSIFWEPGVYGVWLNYMLYYYIFRRKSKNVFEYTIIIINILLTFSTTGIIVGACFVGYYILTRVKKKSMVLFLFFPVVIAIGWIVHAAWMDKWTPSDVTGSYRLRISDLVIGWQLFLSNFIFGTGFANTDIFKLTQGLGRGNSNGFITICFTMGIVGIGLVMYPFICNIIKRGHTKQFIPYILFTLLFVVLNMTEPLFSTPLMLWIIASEYSKKCKGEKNEAS